jgi:hypothetical protein
MLQHPPDLLLLASRLLLQLFLLLQLLVPSINPINHLLLHSLPTQLGLAASLQHRCPQRSLAAGICCQVQHSCKQQGSHHQYDASP